jgi:hypothetical protein
MLPIDEIKKRSQQLFDIMPEGKEFTVKYPKTAMSAGDSRADVTKNAMSIWLDAYARYDDADKLTYLSFCNQIWEQIHNGHK